MHGFKNDGEPAVTAPCLPCPDEGAICHGGANISAKPNYWGTRIRVAVLPPGPGPDNSSAVSNGTDPDGKYIYQVHAGCVLHGALIHVLLEGGLHRVPWPLLPWRRLVHCVLRGARCC